MSKFNERFKFLKEIQNLSAKELSIELRIPQSTLSNYLRNREPNYDNLIAIAEFFGVTVDWLIGRESSGLNLDLHNKCNERLKIAKEEICKKSKEIALIVSSFPEL